MYNELNERFFIKNKKITLNNCVKTINICFSDYRRLRLEIDDDDDDTHLETEVGDDDDDDDDLINRSPV